MDEISLRQELLKLEDSSRQFKREITDARKLSYEIAAFLNSGGGTIYVGVDDDGSIRGLDVEQIGALNQLVGNVATDHLEPRETVRTENVSTSEGTVLVIRVPDGENKPYQTKDGYFYVRSGPDKRKVTSVKELARLFQAGKTAYAELRRVEGTSIADFDVQLLRSYYSTVYKTDLPEDEQLVNQLRNLRLLVDDQMTVAGSMLFGRNPNARLPSFTVKAVWFKGTELGGDEFYDNRQFQGTLAQQYEQAIAFCRRWNARIQVGSSFNSPTAAEIPEIVFEELLTNALVHRDFFIDDSVKLFIFSDRIEIRSPGRLPNSLTIEQAMAGIRRDRNPVIASLGYVLMQYRGLGSGLRRAISRVHDLRIEVDGPSEQVVVTIPLHTVRSDNGELPE